MCSGNTAVAFVPAMHDRAEANARLISAAPELLAALKVLIGAGRSAVADDYRQALAAIDKAEGKP